MEFAKPYYLRSSQIKPSLSVEDIYEAEEEVGEAFSAVC